ncbi:MAG: spore cortex biosynthesis protein YabQ [Oscillospiraceae bacterium]|nr:spore cortex biosynthesis protein YabQ [Oscillospiraceae bacterium]
MIYLPTIELQTKYFFYSIFVGVLIALIYDLFRLIRKIIYKKINPKLYLSDILTPIIASLLLTVFTVVFGFGQIRIYSILGSIIGFVIYINTVGLLTFRIEDFLSFIISKGIAFFVVKPILFLLKVLKKIKCILYNELNQRKTGDLSEQGE